MKRYSRRNFDREHSWKKIPYVVSFVGSLLSLNDIGTNLSRRHAYRYRRYKKSLRDGLIKANVQSIPKAEDLRKVIVIRRYSHGKRDYDYCNLVGGAKALIDILVSMCLLVDDRPKYLYDEYEQMPSGSDDDYIELEIYDLYRTKNGNKTNG